jgi:lipid-A-disaccharide synthase
VLSHFPRLLKIRRELGARLLALKPDVFIGIDAPDFNLGLEIKLRRQGLRTIHYVSPTVWAWRKKRVRKIARAAERVLCLFPFEPDFYANHGVPAVYVGHPMADQISPDSDPVAARATLGLDPGATTISLLPGSRISEVSRLAEPMIEAARILDTSRSGLQFTAAMANEKVQARFQQTMEQLSFTDITLVKDKPRSVMAAADVVICASGTAALETMLVNRPMVVTYRISQLSYDFAKYSRLIRPQLFSLPNILAGEEVVPEVIQRDAVGGRLAEETGHWLDDEARCKALRARFLEIHDRLRRDASGQAAQAVSSLLHSGSE